MEYNKGCYIFTVTFKTRSKYMETIETIGGLGLRKFKYNLDKVVTESTKTGVPESMHIPLNTYLRSKPYLSQSRAQLVPFNGQQLLDDVLERVNDSIPDGDRNWGQVTVYKNHMDIHGYIEKADRHSTYPVLTPDVPVSEVAFGRIITKLNILGDDKYNAAIAVKWEPNFCQVAVGLNVRTCDNYNIFSNTIVQSGLKMNYETLIEYLDKELRQIEEHFGRDIATINRLIETPLNDKSLKYLIGDMSLKYAEDHAILNVTDITELTRNITRDRNAGVNIENMWDLTMAGTKILHFNKNAGDTPLETIQRFNEYVLEMQTKNKRSAS
jgi:hypothetical protein